MVINNFAKLLCKTKHNMPLWEGVLASFCAGVGISLINRFGLSQIKTPCEKRLEAVKGSDSSNDDSGETAGASLASIHAEVHCHHGSGLGGGDVGHSP